MPKKGMPNTLRERAKQIGQSIGINIDHAGKNYKSVWKTEVESRTKEQIQQIGLTFCCDNILKVLKIVNFIYQLNEIYFDYFCKNNFGFHNFFFSI